MYLYFVEESNLEKLAMNKKDKKSGISRIPTTGGIKVGPENIKKILFSGNYFFSFIHRKTFYNIITKRFPVIR